MGRRPGSALCLLGLTLVFLPVFTFSILHAAQRPTTTLKVPGTAGTSAAGPEPIEITADRTEYLQGNDVYEADGSVVVVQGSRRMTADHMTLFMLSGTMVATGHVHVKDTISETRAERLELNVNTEMGVIVNGRVYLRESNTLITGRLVQRFSETHYRIKEGSFTNCDAEEGQTPAWRFTFKDLDLNLGQSVYLNDMWVCVNDRRILKLPTWAYPIQTNRKSGLLIPTIGYDTVFGTHLRQGIFWAISPHQDMMFSPDYLSNRGYGGDVEYRYVLNQRSRGYWLTSYIQDTKIEKSRGMVSGYHRHYINPDWTFNTQAFLLSDPNYLTDLSMSGAQRALPSGESNLNLNRRLAHGNVYLLAQYLQPLTAGGKDTFQRLPEIGHRLINVAPWGGPVLVGMDTTFVNFYRDEGFALDRVDLMPAVSTDVVDIGHIAGFRPQVKFREVYYTRSLRSDEVAHRETFWAALEGTSRLSRRFTLGEGRSLLHTLEPSVMYEYVPRSDQTDIVQVDDVDNLPQKNLITYMLRSRLLEHGVRTNNWLDLTIAQSYHPAGTLNEAREFILPGDPLFGIAQPQTGQPTLVPVQTKKFSDVWIRAVLGNPVMTIRRLDQTLTIDAFYDPYGSGFSQVNADLRFQYEKLWYVELGQRFTRQGNRPRRGDIWNPISFNEVFAPTAELNFVEAAGAIKAPWGWTLGARSYYDLRLGKSPETDVVALWRNKCQCWSFGFYYIAFPDRLQYNFMITLTGVGANENFGTQIMKYILGPILVGERGLPWPGPMGKMPGTPEAMAMPPRRE